MNYKETLNLPKTEFPMKANLSTREPEILARWNAEKIYQQIQEGKKTIPFSFCTTVRLLPMAMSTWAQRSTKY